MKHIARYSIGLTNLYLGQCDTQERARTPMYMLGAWNVDVSAPSLLLGKDSLTG